MHDILKDIRTQCRLGMNGVVSMSMREKGLDYKLNFGLSTAQIRDIAQRYEPNKELSETLWAEETRELKILATLLYPVDEFAKDIAERWISEASNSEIKEQLCFNLLQHLTFARELSIYSCNNADDGIRIVGYLLCGRLILARKLEDSILSNQLCFIFKDITSSHFALQNISTQTLRLLGRQSSFEALSILEGLNKLDLSDLHADFLIEFEERIN